MAKQTSVVELPNAHAENPVGKSVAVKGKRGRPPLSKQERKSMEPPRQLARLQSTAVKKVLLRNGVNKTYVDDRRKDVHPRRVAKGRRRLVYHKTSSDDRRSVLGSLYLPSLCRLQNASSPERVYGWAQHPVAKTKDIYRVRVLLR